MGWTKEEEKALCAGHGFVATTDVLSIATTAVEIVQARGGTMTALQRAEWARMLAEDPFLAEVDRHITAQGATVATLQAKVAELEGEVTGLRTAFDDEQGIARRALNERDALRAEVERLTARVRALDQDSADAMENWRLAQKREQKERVSRKAAESRLAAIRERFAALECDAAERVNLQWVLEGDAPQEAKADPWIVQIYSEPVGDGSPFHPSTEEDWDLELVEEAVSEQPDGAVSNGALYWRRRFLKVVDRLGWIDPQTAQERRGEALDAQRKSIRDAVLSELARSGAGVYSRTLIGRIIDEAEPVRAERYPCSHTCTHDDAATPGHPERVKERSEAFNAAGICATEHCERHSAYDMGAEAMRAACWEAVDALFVNQGLLNLRAALKAAIEGATP